MKSLATLIISLFLFVLSVEAQTKRFSSTQGFSFEYPGEWIVLTKEQQHTLANEYKTVLGKLGEIDFDRIAVAVFNPQNQVSPENVNVVAAPGSMPVNEDSRQQHTRMLPEQMRNMGVTVTDIVSEITTFGSKQALSLQWTMDHPRGGSIRQWQVAVPGRNRTYIITASASASKFQVYEASFKRVFESFEVDGGDLWFWHSLPRVAQYAIVGALIGIAISLLGTLFKKITGSGPDLGRNPDVTNLVNDNGSVSADGAGASAPAPVQHKAEQKPAGPTGINASGESD